MEFMQKKLLKNVSTSKIKIITERIFTNGLIFNYYSLVSFSSRKYWKKSFKIPKKKKWKTLKKVSSYSEFLSF